MDKTVFLILTSVIIILTGCGSDQFKRSTYEGLQHIKRQQCYKEAGSNCDERESYQSYQDKREELQASQ